MTTALPALTRDLEARLDAVQEAHLLCGYQAVAAAPGNPFGLEVAQFGPAVAWRSTVLRDTEPFNRAVGVERLDEAQLEALLAWYREADLAMGLRLSTAQLTDELSRRLSDRGLHQDSFQAMLYGLPQCSLEVSPRVEVSELAPSQSDRFMDVWTDGLTKPPEWRVDWAQLWRPWFKMPGFRLYEATYDGMPAGIAALWCHHGIGELHAATTLLEYRGRGCQAALLRRRIEDARAAGCELVSGESIFGSAGHRNLQRAGLVMACTAAMWRDGT